MVLFMPFLGHEAVRGSYLLYKLILSVLKDAALMKHLQILNEHAKIWRHVTINANTIQRILACDCIMHGFCGMHQPFVHLLSA
jgi:hypothetical protein